MTEKILMEIVQRQAAQEEVLKGLNATTSRIEGKLDGMDERLRGVETRSAVHGSVAGGVISVAVALISAKLKGA